jgi:orotate phosphoribosyltransferase
MARSCARGIILTSTIEDTTMDSTDKAELLKILAQRSFWIAETRLSAGGTSDYYIDCRTTTLSGRGGRLAGIAILDLIRATGLEPKAVGGMTLGADPVVSNVTAASAWHANGISATGVLDGFLVRKEKKAHGAGRQIEGFCEPGAPVVIVDDACTTGASLIAAIHAAQEAEMRIIGVVCVVEREEAGGRPAVEAAALGAPFFSIFRAEEVHAEYVSLSAR